MCGNCGNVEKECCCKKAPKRKECKQTFCNETSAACITVVRDIKCGDDTRFVKGTPIQKVLEVIACQQCYECCGVGSQTIVYEEFRSTLNYEEEPSIDSNEGNPNEYYKSQIEYEITPQDGDGVYEIYMKGTLQTIDGLNGYIGVYVNNEMEPNHLMSWYEGENLPDGMRITGDTTVFKSNINLSVGDVIGIGASDGIVDYTYSIMHVKWKLTKIG